MNCLICEKELIYYHSDEVFLSAYMCKTLVDINNESSNHYLIGMDHDDNIHHDYFLIDRYMIYRDFKGTTIYYDEYFEFYYKSTTIKNIILQYDQFNSVDKIKKLLLLT